MDRESLAALAAAIMEWEGGVLMISHSSEFTSKLCPETWTVANGVVTVTGAGREVEWTARMGSSLRLNGMDREGSSGTLSTMGSSNNLSALGSQNNLAAMAGPAADASAEGGSFAGASAGGSERGKTARPGSAKPAAAAEPKLTRKLSRNEREQEALRKKKEKKEKDERDRLAALSLGGDAPPPAATAEGDDEGDGAD